MEKTFKYHGILSVRKCGNPELYEIVFICLKNGSDIYLRERYMSCYSLILVYIDELLTILHQKVDG